MHPLISRIVGILNRWYSSWILLALVVGLGLLLPEGHPSLAYARTRARAKQCRDQMKVIVSAEQEHFLDHQSFTTEQTSLSRYKPFAEIARCPVCGKRYIIEFTDRDIYIRCPCSESHHGWIHALAPLAHPVSTRDNPE
jgi:hypothetical protein